MRPRLPSTNQFRSSISLEIIPPPRSTEVKNVLILLHGLGDSEVPFAALARRLNLNNTVSIALRGPRLLPPFFQGGRTPGYQWSDDLLYDQVKGDIDLDSGFSTAIARIEEVIEVLIRECDFEAKNIFFFGFGQGAMAGLGFVSRAERIARGIRPPSGLEIFGGFVAIGGGLPKEQQSWVPEVPDLRLQTPVLLCGGRAPTRVTQSVVHALTDRYVNAEYVQWQNKSGDGMPECREEMLSIMQFFSRNMQFD
ncbi:hypothetical protein K3495_g14201 [Podosphaera aphanis]|nr:hypothetical protein K3495_g14201 [Podosphaera aphanis]